MDLGVRSRFRPHRRRLLLRSLGLGARLVCLALRGGRSRASVFGPSSRDVPLGPCVLHRDPHALELEVGSLALILRNGAHGPRERGHSPIDRASPGGLPPLAQCLVARRGRGHDWRRQLDLIIGPVKEPPPVRILYNGFERAESRAPKFRFGAPRDRREWGKGWRVL